MTPRNGLSHTVHYAVNQKHKKNVQKAHVLPRRHYRPVISVEIAFFWLRGCGGLGGEGVGWHVINVTRGVNCEGW